MQARDVDGRGHGPAEPGERAWVAGAGSGEQVLGLLRQVFEVRA